MAKLPKQAGIGTRLTNAGRNKAVTAPFVNPPVVHASTVLFDSVEEMYSGRTDYTYARRGQPTTDALADAISELDGGAGTVLCPSGLSAIATAILAFASAGDHVLVPDSVYGPTRAFATDIAERLGIAITYYGPTIGAAIADEIRPETRAVYVESPGSNTMEMQDLPAIAEAAHRRGATVIADNTWATPLYCDAFAFGADAIVLAATKYIGGHSDIMLGTVSANESHWERLRRYQGSSGLCVGPDDAYLALRGLRTMEVRLERHQRSAIAVAEWLAARPEVSAVLHPALPDDPGHALWRRDMTGASGLFSFVLGGRSEADAARLLDALNLFGLGYSWGGYESLAVIGSHGMVRVAGEKPDGPLIRVHIGLEDSADLIADLEQAFGRL